MDDSRGGPVRDFDFAAEAGQLGLWQLDLVTGVLESSSTFRTLFGVSSPALTRAEARAVLHPDDVAALDAAFAAAVNDGAGYAVEFRVVRDGTVRWIEQRAAVERAPDGTPLRLAGTSLDITARREAETRLALSEESLRLATDAAEVGTWDLDLTTDVLTWSDRTKAMFGIAPDVACSMADFYGGLHPDDREAISAAFAAALDPAQRTTYDVEYRTIGRDDGVTRWVAAKGKGIFAASGTCVRALGTAIDITAARRAADALRASESRLADSEAFASLLLESTSEPFYSVDTEGVTTGCNPAFVRMLGFAHADAAIGRKLHGVIHHTRHDGRAYPVDECPIYRAASTGAPAFVTDELFYRLDGTAFPVEYRAEPIHRGGVLAGAIVTFRDVTAQRAVERALRDLNDTLEARVAERTRERDRVWTNTQDLQCVIDPTGRFLAVNPAWTRTLGWTADEMVGADHLMFNHPDDAPNSATVVATALTHEIPGYECRVLHRDGSYRWFAWVVTSDDGLIYASGRHITAEKEAAAQLAAAEAALRQAQKMEAVGQLTGGIAHDFNNLLQIVVGNIEVMQRLLPDDAERLRRSADNALAGAMRASTLTQRLLTFARLQPLDPAAIDINRCVEGMLDLVGHALGDAVRLATDLAPTAPAARADPNQLESAILNLAVNARDAMPGGGTLTIATGDAVFDATAAAVAGIAPGTYAMVAVADEGEGMDPDTAARVFEPFFTTKPVGKGTGLGLAMVYGFVKQSNGHVAIESAKGVGTTMRLYLPAAAAATAGA